MKSLKRIAIGLCLFFASASSFSQDLLANKAPIDRRLRAADSLSMVRMVKRESHSTPGNDIYSSWVNTKIFCYTNAEVPTEHRIDLRDFAMPCKSNIVTSRVGYRPRFRRMHKGVDIKCYTGDTIYAAFSGKVRMTDYQPSGYGNVVVLRHNNGLETIYGHLSKFLVRENQAVRAGQPIALGGNTGRSFGSHLHFETRLVGALINPEDLFDFSARDIKCDFYAFRKNGQSMPDTDYDYADEDMNEHEYATFAAVESSPAQTSKAYSLQGKIYQVKAGDTVASIARRLDISVETLCNANSSINKNTRLRPAQILRY